jgi:Rad3-related DNA helicase
VTNQEQALRAADEVLDQVEAAAPAVILEDAVEAFYEQVGNLHDAAGAICDGMRDRVRAESDFWARREMSEGWDFALNTMFALSAKRREIAKLPALEGARYVRAGY